MPFDSILFPGHHRPTPDADVTQPECFADLHLDQVISAVTTEHDGVDLARYFHVPLRDTATVTYRHEVFGDLERDEIRRAVESFVANMDTMRQRLHQAQRLWHPLQQQGWFVYAVETYCDAVKLLHDTLSGFDLSASGLRRFTDHVTHYIRGQGFQTLVTETSAVQIELRQIRYNVHVDGLRVHVERFDGEADYSAQIAATFERFAINAGKDYHVRLPDFADMNHVEEQILERVAHLYPKPFERLAEFHTSNTDFADPVIIKFDREIRFYLAYLAFISQLRNAGLPFVYPDITSRPGVMAVEGGFDLALASKQVAEGSPVVGNDFQLSGAERIFVITGPNQGGKTTLARAIGQCAYLAALGCPVPGRRAVLTLPDRIYTHFERQESLSTLRGKLDDELVRIHDILGQATDTSVIVMNESFASTTVNDALMIGTEVLKRMIGLGCVAVYVSFLDELSSFDPACVSMVGEVAPDDPTQRTFRFTRRPADGLAYASALAEKYRLNHEVLLERIAR